MAGTDPVEWMTQTVHGVSGQSPVDGWMVRLTRCVPGSTRHDGLELLATAMVHGSVAVSEWVRTDGTPVGTAEYGGPALKR